jgi:hypothetical protein
VGIAVASDGSLFVSDWATASYELQDRGRIWKLKLKQPLTPGAPVPDLGALVKARRASIAIQNDRTERAAAALESRDRYTQAVVIDVISDFLRSSIKEVKASAIARPALVVAYRRAGRTDALPDFLEDPLPDVKIAALKWIADERLVDLRPQVEAGLKAPHLTRALFAAHLATLERLDRGKVAGDLPNPQALLPVISDTQRPASVRALALSLLPTDHRSLAVDRLRQLLAEGR